MADNQKENKRGLNYLLIGVILICMILVLLEIYLNVTQEIGLTLMSKYVI